MVDAAGPCGATKALAPEMAARAMAEANFMVWALQDKVSLYKCLMPMVEVGVVEEKARPAGALWLADIRGCCF